MPSSLGYVGLAAILDVSAGPSSNRFQEVAMPYAFHSQLWLHCPSIFAFQDAFFVR
jgi:hypothetical protein